MKTWVYYLDQGPTDVFMLYRVKEDLDDPRRRYREDPQVYHRQKGWIADDDMIPQMNRTGFISRDDVISEEEALERIARLRGENGQQVATT